MGIYEDRSGPAVRQLVQDMSDDPDWRLRCVEYVEALVEDNVGGAVTVVGL